MLTIEQDKNYRVKLARATEIAPGIWARPDDEVILTGEVLSTEPIKDNVKSYEEA